MPITPASRAMYPRNWRQIARATKERAGWCCEHCGVKDRAIGWRDDTGAFHEVASDGDYQKLAYEQCNYGDLHRLILIVLTTAHLADPDPSNCDPSNLAALCQRCHNRLDAPMRRSHAAATRKAPNADGDLFADALAAFRRDHATPPRSDAALIEKALEEETHARKHRST